MTVAELIEKLREMPQDAEVLADDNDLEQGLGWYPAGEPEVMRNVEVYIGRSYKKRKIPAAVGIR